MGRNNKELITDEMILGEFKSGNPWRIWIDIFDTTPPDESNVIDNLSALWFVSDIYYLVNGNKFSIAIDHKNPNPKEALYWISEIINKAFINHQINIQTGA